MLTNRTGPSRNLSTGGRRARRRWICSGSLGKGRQYSEREEKGQYYRPVFVATSLEDTVDCNCRGPLSLAIVETVMPVVAGTAGGRGGRRI